ncbi:unnamed protein product [marine sediment metagenome]|uniref:Uncharacterized protein n=1 Tax=marine sediment metagenome TaxID=412755 RepID=X1I7A5_9ZZZZ
MAIDPVCKMEVDEKTAKLEIKGEIAEDYLYEFVNSNRGLNLPQRTRN